jgi:hypothetical protein
VVAALAGGANPDDAARQAAEAAEQIRRLIARGSDLVLADGSTVTIVYSARSFARIEAEYGSLNAYMTALSEGTGGKLFGLLAFTLGLILGQPVDRVWDLIDVRRLNDYIEAMGAALIEAMPPAPEAGRGNPNGLTTAPSPGPDSSTSGWSTSTSRPTISGA